MLSNPQQSQVHFFHNKVISRLFFKLKRQCFNILNNKKKRYIYKESYCIFLYLDDFILRREQVRHLFVVDLHVTASYKILSVGDLQQSKEKSSDTSSHDKTRIVKCIILFTRVFTYKLQIEGFDIDGQASKILFLYKKVAF